MVPPEALGKIIGNIKNMYTCIYINMCILVYIYMHIFTYISVYVMYIEFMIPPEALGNIIGNNYVFKYLCIYIHI
jgi:hypothetical protein